MRYKPGGSQDSMRKAVRIMFRDLGKRDPETITMTDLIRWVTGQSPSPGAVTRNRAGQPLANNTARQRMIAARAFLAHCRRNGLDVIDPTEEFARLRKSYPRTYGKVQDANPGRWLSHSEAFDQLLSACQDGTWIGSRDQLAIRLGLLGLRKSEIRSLTWGNISKGRITWTGKGNRPRDMTLGPTLVQLLGRWRRAYEKGLRRAVRPSDPIICPANRSRNKMTWGTTLGANALGTAVAKRAEAAGLGHVAVHDLRRTAAGIMHRDKTPDGGHRYDLRDVQIVLGHADPATTQRSYLDPIDTDAKDRAALLLD